MKLLWHVIVTENAYLRNAYIRNNDQKGGHFSAVND